MIEYKNYYIKPCKETPTSYVISTSGIGSSIPKEFYGVFTSTGLCKSLIDTYLEKKDKLDDKKASKG